PFSARDTSKPSISRIVARLRRICGWSSMIRIFFIDSKVTFAARTELLCHVVMLDSLPGPFRLRVNQVTGSFGGRRRECPRARGDGGLALNAQNNSAVIHWQK